VRHHMFNIGTEMRAGARRFLAKYGDDLAFELVDHKEAEERGQRSRRRREEGRERGERKLKEDDEEGEKRANNGCPI